MIYWNHKNKTQITNERNEKEMKLQVALDVGFTTETARSLINEIKDSVDIIEVGTPFLLEKGLEPVAKLKDSFPEKEILADMKMADAGGLEAELALKKKADIVTVLGMTEDVTIQNAIDMAHQYGKQVLVDMIAVPNLKERVREIDEMGADYICFHTSKDLQKMNTCADKAFELLKREVQKSKLALAGGISRKNIEIYAAIEPDVIIVGEGITGAADPKGEAEYIKAIMRKYE